MSDMEKTINMEENRQAEVIISRSVEDTYELGRRLGLNARRGQIYCLSGDLGTGKTVFAKGFAAGLGVREDVTSPTFTIMQIYDDGVLPLYHFDAYRIGDEEEMFEIGYEEYFFGDGVTLVEWPEMIEGLIPEDACLLNIEKDPSEGFDYRKITLRMTKELT